MKTKVFLSWSKDRSRKLAGVLRDWIPKVIQAADPWFSDVDIEAGTFWDLAIQKNIQDSKFCIVCVTPENYQSPWLNYESGAIADGLKQKVAPYLLGAQMNDLQSSPLARLQANEADAEGTFKVLTSLNSVLDDPLPERLLVESFEVHWPTLEQGLQALSEPAAAVPKRDVASKVDEVLAVLQNLTYAIAHGSTPKLSKALVDVASREIAGRDEFVLATATFEVEVYRTTADPENPKARLRFNLSEDEAIECAKLGTLSNSKPFRTIMRARRFLNRPASTLDEFAEDVEGKPSDASNRS